MEVSLRARFMSMFVKDLTSKLVLKCQINDAFGKTHRRDLWSVSGVNVLAIGSNIQTGYVSV